MILLYLFRIDVSCCGVVLALVVKMETFGSEVRCVAMDAAGIVGGGRDGRVHSWHFAPIDGDTASPAHWFTQHFTKSLVETCSW
jgi:hypothetical protein